MSNDLVKRAASIFGASTLTLTALMAAAPSASADVYTCRATANTTYNNAQGFCDGGGGRFRVAATCNSGHYPYTTTIYGPWVTRKSGDGRKYSWVYGDPHSCQITKAWVSV